MSALSASDLAGGRRKNRRSQWSQVGEHKGRRRQPGRARLGWCNQAGAGLGVRPTAATGIVTVDAFVWIKPPGESDGVSRPDIVDEDDPFKMFDPMCDPDRQNRYAPGFPTNAMRDAPHRGRWFPQQFVTLVQNAYPPVP